MAMRHGGDASRATLRSAAAPCHLRRGARLINEDERLFSAPREPPCRHVGPLLLAGVCRFFEGLRVSVEEAPDRARSEPLTVLALQVIGDLDQRDIYRLSNEAEYFAAMGLDPSRTPVSALSAWGLPVSRQRRTHFTAVEGATPNRSPAARQVAPCETASIRRSRRSLESGFVIRAGLPASPLDESLFETNGNPSTDSVSSEFALENMRSKSAEKQTSHQQ
jgi:hypothetical protein